MDDVTRMSDADIERLLTGKAPLGEDDPAGLSSFFADAKARYVADPSPAVRQAHLAKMLDAARLPNTQLRPTPPPGADTGNAGRPPWRRKVVLSSLFGSLTAKLVAGAVAAAAAATGGLAIAGALPGASASHSSTTTSSSATLLAEEHQAAQVNTTLGNLINQVTVNASVPSKITSAAVTTAGTCALNVTTLASDLEHNISGALTASGAQSLAARATALGQESIGCALPSTDVSQTVKVPPVITNAASTIGTAIQGCAGPLKTAVETLVQAAIKAKSTADIQALGTDAKAVATAAENCASALGSALKSLAPTLPKIPTSTASGDHNPLAGLLNLIPTSLPKLPTFTGGAGVTATATNPASLFDPANWLKLLSSLPKGFTGGAGVTGTVGTNTGSGWTGITGSWNTGGSWNPYTGSTSGTTSGGFTGTSGKHH